MGLYDVNETMKVLGHQCPTDLLCGDGVAGKDFKNMLDAYRKNGIYSLYEVSVDAFMLGCIYGKRAERSKKKRQSITA